jgi:asparagine synthase (glutamine-hydrolysing)
LERLNGWFSGILVDLREKKIVLFNDRYGLNRIYYHESAEGFYFASEAKALLNVLPQLRQLDMASLGEFFSCGCALQNRTLFSGILLLPPASRWTFQWSQSAKKEVYFRKEVWENQPLLNEPEYYDKLKATFTRILPRYLRGSQAVGMSLTGGLDSRMIMACAGSPPGTLPCYTFGGPYRDCRDINIARRVAKTCRQPYQVIPVDSQFLAQFPALAERNAYLSDGAMDVTGSVELYVNQRARQIAPIRLTGNYGSEIVRRRVAFKPHVVNEAFYGSEFIRLIRAATATYAEEVKGHKLSFIAFKQMPWHHPSRLSVEQSQVTLRSPFLDNEMASLIYQAPEDLAMSEQPCLCLIEESNPALSRIPGNLGRRYRSIPVVTQARHLYEWFTDKAEYAYDSGMPQTLAWMDHLLGPLHLEWLLLGRHYFYHFRVWYRDELSHYVKDILLDPRTRNRPYLRGANLEGLVRSHVQGKRNFTTEIHKILSCELLQRQLIERDWSST